MRRVGLSLAFSLLPAVWICLSPPEGWARQFKVVAIDAGHGGKDRGGVLHGLQEADIVLDISRRIADRISEMPGFSPYLTRWSDDFVPLTQRVLRAEAVASEVLISIHADKVYRRKSRGVILYIYGGNRKIPKGPSRGAGEKRLPPPPRAQIGRSRKLAEQISRALRKHGIETDRYVDKGGFAVLKSSHIPSVLMEVGNLRDKDEAALLTQAQFQKEVARAVAEGIDRFLSR